MSIKKYLAHFLISIMFIGIFTQTFVLAAEDDFTTILQTEAGYLPTYGGYNYHIAEISGTYFLAYSEYANGNSYGTIRIKKSTDKGHTWSDFYVDNQKTIAGAPTLLADSNGRLHIIWGSWNYTSGCYMRFSNPLNSNVPDIVKYNDNNDPAYPWFKYCNAKYSTFYDPLNNIIYWAHRNTNMSNDFYITKLDTSGNVISDTKVISNVGLTYGGDENWQAYYNSLYVDGTGRVHFLYNIYYWYNTTQGGSFVPLLVGYMYSDDQGISWKKANGTGISTPFSANDSTGGGTVISAANESNAFAANILVKNNKIHILYKSDDIQGHRYVRLERTTGMEEKRTFIPGSYIHAALVEDKSSNDIYMYYISESTSPAILVSKDNGDSWTLSAKISDNPPINDFYFAPTASKVVTNDGSVIGMFSDVPWNEQNKANAVFSNFKIRGKNSYYRFERTVSNNSSVFDGASLRLDGQNQIMDESGTNHGNSLSTDNINFGTYENADGTTIPVAVPNIRGAANNNFFAKINKNNNEYINLGNLSVETGLTIEGWFYPTGNPADWVTNGRLISKGDSYRSGDYWLHITDTGKVQFGIYDPADARSWTLNASNKVIWSQWNYIAVTWSKNSKNADIYIKQPNGTMYHETITNNSVVSGFPTISDSVIVGYNSGIFNSGFTGYVDELRISDHCLNSSELLGATDEAYYRFEKTVSSATAVYDGSSLILDGANQVKDETGVINHIGGPVSQDGMNFGTYENIDGSVTPVPYTEIRNTSSNNFFAKMSFDNKEGINLGSQQIGTGLTLEGWFYPTGDSSNWTTNGRLISKGDSYRSGDYWLHITDTGKVLFGIYDSVAPRSWLLSATGKVLWNQWNYISVTWAKDSSDIDIYIKHVNGDTYHEALSNSSVVSGFPISADCVKIGYNSGVTDAGFTGYVDEVRISNYKRKSGELLTVNDSYYRFEQTSSAMTPVYDGASLRLDGTYQTKDETDIQAGNVISYDNTNFGTYESADGPVTPVPYTEIKGASSNNYFAKVNPLNKEDINFGYVNNGNGLTLEGWFNPACQTSGPTTVFSKSAYYLLDINPDGSLTFELNPGDMANSRLFKSSAGLVQWGQWNYIAVSWEKSKNYITFYVKQPGSNNLLYYQAVECKEGLSTLGKGTPLDTTVVRTGGNFEGYMDEIRISKYARSMNDLLVVANSSVDLSNDQWYYRFEKTAAGTSPVTDGVSLKLDGDYQVKNDKNGYSGANPFSQDDLNYGTYESSDGSGVPVPFMAIKGITSNNYFAKISFTNKEGINLGPLQVRNGLTIEGWFYPTGNSSEWATNGRLISKGNSYSSGDYWLLITDTGKVQFGIYDSVAPRSWLLSATGKILWNQWNYIAVTWVKDSKDIDIYIKQPNGTMYHETLTNTSVVSGFPITSDNVKIGYNAGVTNAGFTGYVDEVRISNYKLQKDELSAANVAYYRLEQTESNITPVTDNASLRLDGTYQVRNGMGNLHGNPVSLNGINFGTYENTDGSVTPVSILDITGATSNNFFGKLNFANQEGVSLGDLDASSGLTLEGWFYPTGNILGADNSGYLITKCTSSRPGNFWLKLNSSGGVTFEVNDSSAIRTWDSATNVVMWNQWNYIAVRWNKDSQDVEFNVKPQSGQMYNETKRNTAVVTGFPDTDDNVIIGYNAALNKGFNGYFDEVRISDYRLERRQMLFAGEHQYRFDSTTSDSTFLRNGLSLRTDGDHQIKDETGAVDGNPFSQSGSSDGTYNYWGQRGQCTARFNSNKQNGINLGDLDVGTGLTLEGWFRFEGNMANAYDQSSMISKLSSWKPGAYWLCLTSEGRINFGIYDVTSGQNGIGWYSSPNLISTCKTYYIAVTWQKNTNTVDFYVTTDSGLLYHETVTVPYTVGGFPNINDDVTLGYSPDLQRGYQGTMDNVRISNWKVDQNHLLYKPSSSSYYRLEKTASDFADISNNASLRLDGVYQIKDEYGQNANSISLDNSNFGTYNSVDGSVSAIPYTEIKGAANNSFFGKLNYSNKESVFLNYKYCGSGLTLEGWFYPTGNQADANLNGLLISKYVKGGSGSYWLQLNPFGGVTFNTKDSLDTNTWNSSPSLVQWNNWNYIAITWNTGSNTVDFHIKPLNGSLTSETKTLANNLTNFYYIDDAIKLGYNQGLNKGFQGYFDEIRISNTKIALSDLLIN